MLLRDRRGLTELETAIIVIAFVKVAAAFAMLNMGFQTSQRSTEVMQSGLREASSALELDGAVIAYARNVDNDALHEGLEVENFTFCIKLSAGKHPIDVSNETLVMSHTDPNLHMYDVYDGGVHSNLEEGLELLRNSSVTAVICQIRGGNDNMLGYGEKFLVAINITKIYGGPSSLGLNDQVVIEVKPPVGAILTVVLRLPPVLDTVMNLG